MKSLIIRLINKYERYFHPQIYAVRQGVKFGNNCIINKSINFGSEPYLITIGDNFYSSANIQFITHDGAVNVIRNLHPEYQDIDDISPITIGNNVFLGYGVVVLPGCIIGDNVIVGACSVAKGQLKSNSIYAGIPAKFICSLDEYILKREKKFIFTHKLSPQEKRSKLEDIYKNRDDGIQK